MNSLSWAARHGKERNRNDRNDRMLHENHRIEACTVPLKGKVQETHVLRHTTAIAVMRTRRAPIPIVIPIPMAFDDSNW